MKYQHIHSSYLREAAGFSVNTKNDLSGIVEPQSVLNPMNNPLYEYDVSHYSKLVNILHSQNNKKLQVMKIIIKNY